MSTYLSLMADMAVNKALEASMQKAIDGGSSAAPTRISGEQVIAAAKQERARIMNAACQKRHRDKKRLATQQAQAQALAIAAASAAAGAADGAATAADGAATAAAHIANVAPPPVVANHEIDGPGVPGYAGDEADFELDDFESDDDGAGPSEAAPMEG